ncbi:glycosyltransferase family 2 protein [Massilibacteroides vaginae]|uniref:glycosyltransferase family 2 protein n=1 Tax=Massilibacteroides vaginae TaxID=1673718 RepID=UPI000A1CA756|nr:glycosyltransferase family A protein [Massilibacteroides vaginae]
MKIPLVSVVIPVYNTPKLLEITLKSVINQTVTDVEILVIDDGSTVDIEFVINRINDNRIKYYKLEHTNANVARNYGIRKSVGRYIAMLDSDDLWCNNHLQECFELLQDNADGLYGSLILKKEDISQGKTFFVRALKQKETMVDYLLQNGYGAQTSTFFMTADSMKDILWDPKLKRHQDYDFVIRYSKKYKLIPKLNPTVIYTIKKNITKIDFSSCICFIQRNKHNITPMNYLRYYVNMLILAKQYSENKHIITYYKNEASRYKELLSYAEYIAIVSPQNIYQKVKAKLSYLFSILFVTIG